MTSHRWFRRLAAAALLGSAVLASPAPRAEAAPTRWAAGDEMIVRVPPGTSIRSLITAAWTNGWNMAKVARVWDPAAAQGLWRLWPRADKIHTSPGSFLPLLRTTSGVTLAVKNSPFRLSSGPIPPGDEAPPPDGGDDGDGYGGDQSEMPFFDDELEMQAALSQPAVEEVGLPEAHTWAQGDGVTVAVLDGGFDLDHELLRDRLAINLYDAISGDNDPEDPGNGIDDDEDGVPDRGVGHGTAVAGVIAVTAPAARILPIRVLDDEGNGNAATLALGIRYAVSVGAKVVNLSASGPESNALLEEAIRDAYMAGVMVCCTPGNDGVNQVCHPGCYRYAFCVAGTVVGGAVDWISNYGRAVEIGSPSAGIVAPAPQGSDAYAYWHGTSFAAPFYAGSAALMLEANPGMSGMMAAWWLVADAAPYESLPPDRVGNYGQGLLDAAAAVAP
jgi:hypothetical protein